MLKTAKDKILYVLEKSGRRLISPEICREYENIMGEPIGYLESCIERRAREMRETGHKHYLTGKTIYLTSREREGKNYIEWAIDSGELF